MANVLREPVEYNPTSTVSGVPGGLDLADPLVPGCWRCGSLPTRINGVLTMHIDKQRRLDCGCECPACKGEGVVMQGTKAAVCRVICPTCAGLGFVTREAE